MNREYYAVTIVLSSGETVEFEHLDFNTSYVFDNEHLYMDIGTECGISVNIRTKNNTALISRVKYRFTISMKNYAKVIVPDSGRWFLRTMSLIDFWKNRRHCSSYIGDIKTPLFMFINNDFYVGRAIGIVGKNHETEFNVVEPESNRALNVHTGNIILDIIRGNDDFPLNKRTYEEGVFYYAEAKPKKYPWMLVQREFTQLQRKKYGIQENYQKHALEPMWCSWVEWDSKDIHEEMLLANMKAGVYLGIKNFIIDDGWYGNGLDSNYSTDMDIGDWEPDLKKIPDMKNLVEKAHELGARPIIWCAPHAVALKSKAFQANKEYLISDDKGIPILNEPQYYSYCFQCREGREIMADICLKLIKNWGFDGAKYDLFNWVPDVKCQNPNHTHDVDSMIAGLEKTLALIDENTRKIKSDYIVELKQNYGTLFNMQYGNLMRAGDAPFDLETNYQRTLHIQSYTSYALNDYQTFTEDDSKEDVACCIIKMLAAGVPAYGVNFQKLTDEVGAVIKYYNELYTNNLDDFKNFRIPLNPNNTAMLIEGEEYDYVFLLPTTNFVEVGKNSVIFNGTYEQTVYIKNIADTICQATIKDCMGKVIQEHTFVDVVSEIRVSIGGSASVSYLR